MIVCRRVSERAPIFWSGPFRRQVTVASVRTQGVRRVYEERTWYAASTCSYSPTVSPVQLFREVPPPCPGSPSTSPARPSPHQSRPGLGVDAGASRFSAQGDVGFEDWLAKEGVESKAAHSTTSRTSGCPSRA